MARPAAGRLSLPALLDALEAHGALDDRPGAEGALARRSVEAGLPIYARVLAGLGAFISALCFALAVALLDVVDFDSAATLLLIGVPLAALALPLRRAGLASPGTAVSSFVLQLSFFAMAAGKLLAVWGVAIALDTEWGLAIGAAIATVATYRLYPSPIDRFASVYATTGVLVALVLWDVDSALARDVAVHLVGIACLGGSATLLVAPRAPGWTRPAAFAMLFALVTLVVMLTTPDALMGWRPLADLSQWPLRAALALTIGVAAARITREAVPARMHADLAAVGAVAALALALVADPGVTLAVAMLALGHGRHERVLVAGGLVLLPAFLGLYYYSLDLDLATKAGVLVASGLVLLAARWYLTVRVPQVSEPAPAGEHAS